MLFSKRMCIYATWECVQDDERLCTKLCQPSSMSTYVATAEAAIGQGSLSTPCSKALLELNAIFMRNTAPRSTHACSRTAAPPINRLVRFCRSHAVTLQLLSRPCCCISNPPYHTNTDLALLQTQFSIQNCLRIADDANDIAFAVPMRSS